MHAVARQKPVSAGLGLYVLQDSAAVANCARFLHHTSREEGTGRAAAPPSPLLAVPNVTAHPSTASVPTSYYLMWPITAFAL